MGTVYRRICKVNCPVLTSSSAIMKLALICLFGLVAMACAFEEVEMDFEDEEMEMDDMEVDDGSGGRVKCAMELARCLGSECVRPCRRAFFKCQRESHRPFQCFREMVRCFRSDACNDF